MCNKTLAFWSFK